MKRPLHIIALCLLLGVVVNVSVAWACAVWCRIDSRAPETKPTVSSASVWQRRAGTGWPDRPDDFNQWEYFGATLQLGYSFVPGRGVYQAAVESFGWPVRSLAWDFWDSPATGMRYGSVLPRDPSPPTYDSGVMVPIRPVWRGFALNTIFYATILWLLIPGPFVLRRFIRRRRSQCPACGYPAGESAACTECGKELPRRLVSMRSRRRSRGDPRRRPQTAVLAVRSG